MGFSRQEYWSGLPFPSPENLPDPGVEPGFPALKANSLPSELEGSDICVYVCMCVVCVCVCVCVCDFAHMYFLKVEILYQNVYAFILPNVGQALTLLVNTFYI